LEFFHRVLKFVENRGKSETGGNASWPQGNGRPCRRTKTFKSAVRVGQGKRRKGPRVSIRVSVVIQKLKDQVFV